MLIIDIPGPRPLQQDADELYVTEADKMPVMPEEGRQAIADAGYDVDYVIANDTEIDLETPLEEREAQAEQLLKGLTENERGLFIDSARELMSVFREAPRRFVSSQTGTAQPGSFLGEYTKKSIEQRADRIEAEQAQPVSDLEAAQYGLELISRFNFRDIDLVRLAHRMSDEDVTPKQKLAFHFLQQMYEKKDITWDGLLRATGNLLTSPSTYVGVGTFGIATAAAQAAKTAGKEGIKAYIRSQIPNAIALGLEGGAYASLDDAMKQTVEIEAARANPQIADAMNLQQEFQFGENVAATGLGVAAGGTIGMFGNKVIDKAGEAFTGMVRGAQQGVLGAGVGGTGKPPQISRLRAGGQDNDAAKARIAEISGGKRVLIDHLATYFDEDHLAKRGRKLDPNDDADFQLGIDDAVEEINYQLTQAVSGKGWYDNDVATTFETIAQIPGLESLGTNDTHRVIWSAIAGATSNGQKVVNNTRVAIALMRHYLQTGELITTPPAPDSTIADIPKVGFGVRSASVGKSLSVIKHLLDDLGEEGFADWWLSPHSLKEITDVRKAAGLKGGPGGVGGGQKSIHLGARAIGDKTGQFSLNINGYEGTTKDSWFTRGYNRIFGQMRRADGEIAMQPRDIPERKRQEQFVSEIQKRLQAQGMTEQDIQAVLWYQEQNLYTDLGVLSRPEGFSEGARRTNEAIGLRTGVRTGDADEAAPEPGSTLTGYRDLSGRQRAVRQQRRNRIAELNSGGSDGRQSRPYRSDSSEDAGRTRLVADEEVAKRYEKAGLRIPSITQLDAAQSAADYAQRMQSAMVNHEFGAQVELKTADELSKYKLYQTDDDAGFALKPDGDVVAVYSGASEPRNGLFSVLQAAIDQGGRKLDAFNTMLPKVYQTVGFKPVARVKWNDEFAPKPPFAAKAWDKETYKEFNNGEPDIVLMVYDPDYFGGVNMASVPRFDDFDEAAAIQNAEVERLAPRVNEIHGTE